MDVEGTPSRERRSPTSGLTRREKLAQWKAEKAALIAQGETPKTPAPIKKLRQGATPSSVVNQPNNRNRRRRRSRNNNNRKTRNDGDENTENEPHHVEVVKSFSERMSGEEAKEERVPLGSLDNRTPSPTTKTKKTPSKRGPSDEGLQPSKRSSPPPFNAKASLQSLLKQTSQILHVESASPEEIEKMCEAELFERLQTAITDVSTDLEKKETKAFEDKHKIVALSGAFDRIQNEFEAVINDVAELEKADYKSQVTQLSIMCKAYERTIEQLESEQIGTSPSVLGQSVGCQVEIENEKMAEMLAEQEVVKANNLAIKAGCEILKQNWTNQSARYRSQLGKVNLELAMVKKALDQSDEEKAVMKQQLVALQNQLISRDDPTPAPNQEA